MVAVEDTSEVELREKLIELIRIKRRYKRLDVAIHELGVQLTVKLLKAKHPEAPNWQVNPGAEPGIDITAFSGNDTAVAAEFTAHEPIHDRKIGPRFGANQQANIRHAIGKLLRSRARRKYLVVATSAAEQAARAQFDVEGIELTNLGLGG